MLHFFSPSDGCTNEANLFQNITDDVYSRQIPTARLALISPDKVTELSFLHAVGPAFQRGITIAWKPSSHVLKCIRHCAIRVGSEGLCVRGGGVDPGSFRMAIHQVFPRALPGQGLMVPVWFPNALFSRPLSAAL